MEIYARRWALALALLWPLAAGAEPGKAPMESEEMAHIREELGVNEFTAPSIGMVFDELNALKPFPFDKVWRDLPDSPPQNRMQLALTAGAVIADGFLAVTSEKQSRIQSVGRLLLKLAKGLGVGEHVTKHSRSILEKASQQKWSDVKLELVRAQADVEGALLGLKDEEIAHLVSLGGWLRGLEMTSSVVIEDYSSARARRLNQPEMLDYFIARAGTLNPTFTATKLGQTLQKNLEEIRVITNKPGGAAVTLEEAKKVRDLAREINKLATRGEE